MGNLTYEQLQSSAGKKKQFVKFKGPTIYKYGDKEFKVAPWNHPATIAKFILNIIIHHFFYGIYIVAPMGHGKTTIAQSIAHFIHLQDPRYEITWAGGYEFTHQEQFFKSLPKKPQVIIFDDVSGDLKQLTDKEVEANFSSLTRVRWILDPLQGKIPVICIVVGHYSKNLEKEFRAQLGMSIYAAFGNEELTNIDTIAPKGSPAHNTLLAFRNLYIDMFEKHKFTIYLGYGQKIEYNTDNPFRCYAAISKTKGKIILYSNNDVCEKCVKKRFTRLVPAQMVYDKIYAAYGNQGLQALDIFQHIHGFSGSLHPNVSRALQFIENEINPILQWDYREMENIRWKAKKKTPPKRTYRKVKLNNDILNDLVSNATVTTQPVNKIINPPVENNNTNNGNNTGYE